MILGLTDPSGAAATWRAFNSRNLNNVYTRASSNAEYRQQGNQPRLHNAFNYKKQDIVGLRGNPFDQQNDNYYWQSYQLGPNIRNPLKGGYRNAMITNEGVYNINPIAGSNAFGGGLVSAASGLNPMNYSLANTSDIDDRIRASAIDPNNPLSAQYAKNLAKSQSPLEGDVAEGGGDEGNALINNYATPASLIRQAQTQVAMGYDVEGIETSRPVYDEDGQLALDENDYPIMERYRQGSTSTDPEAIQKLKERVQEEAVKGSTGASNSQIMNKYEGYLKNLPNYNYKLPTETQIVSYESNYAQNVALDSGASDPGILEGLQNIGNSLHSSVADSSSLTGSSGKNSAASRVSAGAGGGSFFGNMLNAAKSLIPGGRGSVGTLEEVENSDSSRAETIDSGTRQGSIAGSKRSSPAVSAVSSKSSKTGSAAVNSVNRLNRQEQGLTLESNDELQSEIREDDRKASMNYSVVDPGNGVEEVTSEAARYQHDAVIKFNMGKISEAYQYQKRFLRRHCIPLNRSTGIYSETLLDLAHKLADIFENHGIMVDVNALAALVHAYFLGNGTAKNEVIKMTYDVARQLSNSSPVARERAFKEFKSNYTPSKWESDEALGIDFAKMRLQEHHEKTKQISGYTQGNTTPEKNNDIISEVIEGRKQTFTTNESNSNTFAGVQLDINLEQTPLTLGTSNGTLQDRGTLPSTTPISLNTSALPLLIMPEATKSWYDSFSSTLSTVHKSIEDVTGVYDDIKALTPLPVATDALMSSIGGVAKGYMYTADILTPHFENLKMSCVDCMDATATNASECAHCMKFYGKYGKTVMKIAGGKVLNKGKDIIDVSGTVLAAGLHKGKAGASAAARGVFEGARMTAAGSYQMGVFAGEQISTLASHTKSKLPTWTDSISAVKGGLVSLAEMLTPAERSGRSDVDEIDQVVDSIAAIAQNSEDMGSFESNIEGFKEGFRNATGVDLPVNYINARKIRMPEEKARLAKKIKQDLAHANAEPYNRPQSTPRPMSEAAYRKKWGYRVNTEKLAPMESHIGSPNNNTGGITQETYDKIQQFNKDYAATFPEGINGKVVVPGKQSVSGPSIQVPLKVKIYEPPAEVAIATANAKRDPYSGMTTAESEVSDSPYTPAAPSIVRKRTPSVGRKAPSSLFAAATVQSGKLKSA